MEKDQNANTTIPLYALVYWTEKNTWSVVLSADVPNKRMLHNPKVLDDIPFKFGEEPPGGYK